MTSNDGNKYKIARQMAGLTQERWAEALGVDVRSVQRYEQGENLPPDDVVEMMVEISGLAPLGYWHLKNKSWLASALLPEVAAIPLPQAVVQMICAIENFAKHNARIMEIASDGVVDPDQVDDWETICRKLDGVVKCAIQLKCSGGATYAQD